MNDQICCPPFDPKPWEQTIVSFDDQFFMKVKVLTFNSIPLNFGSVMTRARKLIGQAGAKVVNNIALCNHVSKWTMEVYIAIDKEFDNLKAIRLPGTFLSNVYEGPFKDTAIWCKDFERLAKEKEFVINTWYMWYTTCPKCAKKYGKNYVVVLAR